MLPTIITCVKFSFFMNFKYTIVLQYIFYITLYYNDIFLYH